MSARFSELFTEVQCSHLQKERVYCNFQDRQYKMWGNDFPNERAARDHGRIKNRIQIRQHGGVSSIYGKLIMNDYALGPVTLLNYFCH